MTQANDYSEFLKTHGGEALFSTAGLICVAGDAAHDADPAARDRWRVLFDALLDAAAVAGWPGRDLLETRFARGEKGPKVRDLCREAALYIAPGALASALAVVGAELRMLVDSAENSTGDQPDGV